MVTQHQEAVSSSTEKTKSKLTRVYDRLGGVLRGLRPFGILGIFKYWQMEGKIDFIVCEMGGAWYIESLSVPEEIAVQTNPVLVEWAKRERFADDPDVVFIAVYWRDEILDETGLTTDAVVSSTYQKMKGKLCYEN